MQIFHLAVERLRKCEAIITDAKSQISVTDQGHKLIHFLAKTIHPLLATVWVSHTTCMGTVFTDKFEVHGLVEWEWCVILLQLVCREH